MFELIIQDFNKIFEILIFLFTVIGSLISVLLCKKIITTSKKFEEDFLKMNEEIDCNYRKFKGRLVKKYEQEPSDIEEIFKILEKVKTEEKIFNALLEKQQENLYSFLEKRDKKSIQKRRIFIKILKDYQETNFNVDKKINKLLEKEQSRGIN